MTQNELPTIIYAWKPEILPGEITASSHPTKPPAVKFYRHDVVDRLVEALEYYGKESNWVCDVLLENTNEMPFCHAQKSLSSFKEATTDGK